jgi:hypothetical protein
MDEKVKSVDYKKVLPLLLKYKYLLVVIMIGILLMLWPVGKSLPPAETAQSPPELTLTETEERISASLEKIEGVGRIELVLTMRQDHSEFLGALVVCDGADNNAVAWQVVNAVMSLTGLQSDRITVAKMKN